MSKLQEQRRNRFGTRIYAAGFEKWMVRPCYVVHTFTGLAHNAINLSDAHHELRKLPAYRTERAKHARLMLARFIQHLRNEHGLTPADVRSISLSVIDAPESYAGTIGAQARSAARVRILNFGLAVSA